MKSIASKIRRDIRHFGIARTAYMVFMRGINLCFDLRIIRVFKNEVADPAFLHSDEGFDFKFLDRREMFALVGTPDTELTDRFVQTAIDKGDECYSAFDGEELANFCWYAHEPTDEGGLTFHCRSDYVYQYAAFAPLKYRGRRVSALRGNRARREFLSRGLKGVVYIIDSHNFRSLRSAFASLGVQNIGYIFVFKIGNFAWIHNSGGCRKHGIHLAQPAAAPELVPTA